ncbi:deoxyribose-phosphate aldolase [Ileibacterium valens]|uniref:deoxyribose-phosphate aldolase n=1 Tax=Ileibacterium valens TaxID=1862668 RepID=UPI00272C58B7|nr:deoxyribose-phosphate aldolase [Ileibacterium valens]
MKPLKKAAEMTQDELAAYIDYSVLKPEFTEQEIIELTEDGKKLKCATICINPGYLDLCDQIVQGSKTGLCPVVDFPFGTSSTESRVEQIAIAAQYPSVKEVDIVANFGKIRSGKLEEVTDDLKACVKECHKYGKELKVILETDALTEYEIRAGARAAIKAGADFLKTSTGFLTGYPTVGASPEVIEILMEEADGKAKIKGSGCIRTRDHFLKLIDMGIDRMGIGYRSVPVVLDLSQNN